MNLETGSSASAESFQKLMHELLCVWHDVKKPNEMQMDGEEKVKAIKKIVCRLLSELDHKVANMPSDFPSDPEKAHEFFEEWAVLTWNVLCVAVRLQDDGIMSIAKLSSEERVILARLNAALVGLVNKAHPIRPPPGIPDSDPSYERFFQHFAQTLHTLHGFYSMLDTVTMKGNVHEFVANLAAFGETQLQVCIDTFKEFSNQQSERLWRTVRAAQAQRMSDFKPMPFEAISPLVAFYTNMVYTLGILAARLQGFRYESVVARRIFVEEDPGLKLVSMVFSALELLLLDAILASEPSTNAILVTNNLFPMQCGALVRGILFRDFQVQIVSEETAGHIQMELRRQKVLRRASALGNFPSAALLAMKPATGVKRNNATVSAEGGNTAHKKSDVNSKESVFITPTYNAKHKFWSGSYPHLLCTTRQKDSVLDSRSGQIGKRPLFYFHVKATVFSPAGGYAAAHTLSLPFTIATRRNQDCQVQRMMSSYTATCFWLYGTNVQDGLLITWSEAGISWEHFKRLYNQHFMVNAEVKRGFRDEDFDLLRQKLQCHDCMLHSAADYSNGYERRITFKNVLCPHLRYECSSSTPVRFSVWRGMLELLQIFQDQKSSVRQLWESDLIFGFLDFDQACKLLKPHEKTMCMRLSFVTGGSICFSMNSSAHVDNSQSILHLEPLDLKRLQAKSLLDYIKDIASAEKVKYILNVSNTLVPVSEVLASLKANLSEENFDARDIRSNVTHSGDVDSMQDIRFTALRIAVVTCKAKPASEYSLELEQEVQRNPTGLASHFASELHHLMAAHGKSPRDVIELLLNSKSVGSSLPTSCNATDH